MIEIALVDIRHNKYLEEAREILRKDINADLTGLSRKMITENRDRVKRERVNVINTLIIGAIFNYNYEACRLAITKGVILSPSKDVTVNEANKILMIMWGSLSNLLDNDFSPILNEIDRYMDTEKAFDGELPFV
jgi:hypothetical protein